MLGFKGLVYTPSLVPSPLVGITTYTRKLLIADCCTSSSMGLACMIPSVSGVSHNLQSVRI